MAGSWSSTTITAGFTTDMMLLLTDGSVMCNQLLTNRWHRLTPDSQGSYIKGSWSSLAPMLDDPNIPTPLGGPNYAPYGFASAVLKDGRVFIAGGEYNGIAGMVEVAEVQIYDPVADAWTIATPLGWTLIGDAPSCVLPDGRVLIGSVVDTAYAIYNPNTDSWTTAGTKGDMSAEETFTLLPDDTVLTVQCSETPNAEKYVIATDSWVSAGQTPSALPQPCTGIVPEIGPALLLPDGRVFAIGASGNTALYKLPANAADPGTWAAGPTLKDSGSNTLYPMDAPAVLLPNGKVLLTASPGPPCNNPAPTTFFEYDPSTNQATIVGSPVNGGQPCYKGRLLLLPNGQVLFTSQDGTISVYNPDGSPQNSWRPANISVSATLVTGNSYTVTGTQINGLSQACSYGDDAQMATNYPIVRLVNKSTGQVKYVRSYDFSTMGVATGTTVPDDLHSCTIDIPTGLAQGSWDLFVVANGIASDPVTVQIVNHAFYFTVDKSSFGADEVTDAPVYSKAFWLTLEGYAPNAVTGKPALSGAFNNDTDLVITPDNANPVYTNPGDLNAPQRITWYYNIHFNAPPFHDFPMSGTSNLSLTAGLTVQGQAYQAITEFELVSAADPFFANVNPSVNNAFWLSQDLRVFTATPGDASTLVNGGPPFNPANPNALDIAAAYSYIQGVLTYLNTSPIYTTPSATDPLDNLPQQGYAFNGPSSVNPHTTTGVVNYNFAIARVRLTGSSGISGEASNVKVFFRLFNTPSNDTDFQPVTTYRSMLDSATQMLPESPLSGLDMETYPFFASDNFGGNDFSGASYNNKTIEIISGNSIWAYFGCFLNVYDPTPVLNGLPLQAYLGGTHHCLVAQIAYDQAPIVNANGVTKSPENSDKLAQRNLQVTLSENPQSPATHRIPQAFDMRPSLPLATSSGSLLDYPDELLIDWGNTPAGSVVSIYWPGMDTADILRLARLLYLTKSFTALDSHTILYKVTDAPGYIPIPPGANANAGAAPGTNPNFAGLLTVDLPPTVIKGQEFNIVVKRVSSRRMSAERDMGSKKPVRVMRNWRYIVGSFQIKIPVTTSAVMLWPEENTLAILKWRLANMPAGSRWHPVIARYIDYIAARVDGLGGNSAAILPSINGVPAGNAHEKVGHTGKVCEVLYDCFGEFEGFVLNTCRGYHRFRSCRKGIERVVLYACKEQLNLTVVTDGQCGMDIAGLTLQG